MSAQTQHFASVRPRACAGGAVVALASAACALALGCGSGDSAGGSGLTPEAELIARGKHYYESVCTACHAGNPAVDGTLGPALAGTSLAVLEAKVLHGTYPEGYTPKRQGGAMPRFQYLEPELPAIAAYLASVGTASVETGAADVAVGE